VGISDVSDSLKLCHFGEKGLMFLNEIACKPTGVALGCPLPVKPLAKKLFRIAQIIERYISGLIGLKQALAFVPKELYHITIANYTHFEQNTNVVDISRAEYDKIINSVKNIKSNSFEMILNGLILTTNGRLIVRGFPVDPDFFHFRRQLCARIPEMENKIPPTAHIKLGHLIKTLDPDEYARVLLFIERCSIYATARLSFPGLFTPVGEISF
jgi:hypothetical protein